MPGRKITFSEGTSPDFQQAVKNVAERNGGVPNGGESYGSGATAANYEFSTQEGANGFKEDVNGLSQGGPVEPDELEY